MMGRGARQWLGLVAKAEEADAAARRKQLEQDFEQLVAELESKINAKFEARLQKLETEKNYYNLWAKILVKSAVKGEDPRRMEEWPNLIQVLDNEQS